MQITFPTPDQITAALQEMLDVAQRAYDATDRAEKEERAFWKRQRNAFVNAIGDVEAGRLPILSGDGYLMPSASNPGSFHRAWKDAGIWRCSCPAGDEGIFHRHTALISGIERALDLIEQGLIGAADAEIPEDTDPDDFSDVGERAPLDSPALVASLVQRLTVARAARIAA